MTAARDATLKGERGHRNFPTLVEWANDVVLGDLHIIEKDFVKMMMPVHHDQRSHLYAGRFHVIEQQVTDSLMLGRLRIGSGEQEHLVRELGSRRPHLLS